MMSRQDLMRLASCCAVDCGVAEFDFLLRMSVLVDILSQSVIADISNLILGTEALARSVPVRGHQVQTVCA